MHQRPPADPANRDDFAAATMGQPVRSAQATQTAQTAQGDYHGGGSSEGEEDDEGSRVDLFDDVFGAAGPADTTRSPGAAAAAAAAPAEAADAAAAAAVHPSDMHRLHTDHATAGYRDGLTSAKAASVQAGFDEGYALGAALGSVAGHLVGLLEAVVAAAYEDGGGDPDGELAALLARARQQLAVTSMFAPAYFAPDGTWLYDVPGGAKGAESTTLTESAGSVKPTESKAPGDNHDDHTIYDVARAHPLVRSWHDLLAARLPALGVRWGVDGDADDEAAVAAALGLQSEEDKDDDDDNDKEQPRQSPATRQKTDRTSTTNEPTTTTTTTTNTTTTTSRPPPSSNASALDW